MVDVDSSKPLDIVLDKDYDDSADCRPQSTAFNGLDLVLVNLSEGERSYLISTFTTNRQRHRRLHQIEVRAQERRQTKIEKLRDLFLQDEIWYSEGGPIAIKDMTPNHALNSYNLVTKEWGRYAGYSIAYSELGIYTTLLGTPLVRALSKRAGQRSTRRDKRKDNEARERYKDRQAKRRALASSIFNNWNEF